ncbi:hypothetical protein [Mangrovimonas spongiae]|uniref:Uncharacterized protein n=1 Tax=Mangrovimonas spongiae TaxID=2494697 RepID=A0A428K262_9FLAO|nr:hypothetical protein [Mangrovimonas spongiae]RSK40465.1 hypothetical protein EJA19_05665 [Mangrovimonas spongiae]
MNYSNFSFKLTFYIVLGFILFTIIGTLSHEMGHIVVAKYFGYDTTLSYGSMNYYPKGYMEDEDTKRLIKLNETYFNTPYEALDDSVKKEFENVINRIETKFEWKNTIWVTLGGPIQTILTSFLGFIILYFRKSFKKETFKLWDWLAIFLSLFILREVFNTVMALVETALGIKSSFNGDEFKISRYLGYNPWVIPVITAGIGLLISIGVIFKILPKQYRLSFIIAGFIGGVLGYSVWFGFLGNFLFSL